MDNVFIYIIIMSVLLHCLMTVAAFVETTPAEAGTATVVWAMKMLVAVLVDATTAPAVVGVVVAVTEVAAVVVAAAAAAAAAEP